MSHQSRFDARYWMLGAGALGWPGGMVWGGRREEGSGWGTHVYLWQIHFDIWQNQYNIVKLNKKKNKIKSRDITLPTKVRLVKGMVFPVVTYGCESWAIKKAERQRIDAFELWCWRRLLRIPWTARRSNQCILFFFLILFYFLTLQYCIGFAIYQHESATGIHVFPILSPPPSSLWVIPVHQPQASSIVHRTWTGDSFHTWYYTCFNAVLPNLPTLSLSHRVHKTDLYISVSFAVSYSGLLLPSF